MDDFTDRSQFRIGDLLVIPGRLIVVRDGQKIKFEPRWMEVLVMLAEHVGETLSTERLLIEVWGSTVYGDSPVSKTISYIRKSISDDSRKPRYVETVSKVGYRLIAPVSLPEDYRRMPSERWTKGSPYVGLSAFGADHASVFCGRSRIVADLLRAMRVQIENQRRFVLIVGASGCGKTSLLRAGAIPLLTKPDGFDGLRAVSVTTCDLAANGSDPLIPLTAALAAWTLGTRPVFPPQTAEQLKALLTETPDMIEGFVSEAFRRHSERDLAEQPYTHLLLTVDHAEALVATTDVDADARDAFARVLQALCACPHVMVTMIARGDFYLKLIEALPALAELKAGDGHLDVMAPRYGEIGEIIRSPAWKADLSFETDPETRTRLDDALRDAALSQPDALPLLQHTLQTLYERRNAQQQLTFAAYNDIGGLEGAVSHRAEQVFATLPENAQASLDSVLAELIVIQPDSDAVNARRTSIDAFDTDASALVDVFTAARLFVRDHYNGQPTVGVVHEALLRRWPRAVEWTQDNRRLLQARARLQRAAARWAEEGRQDDHLLNPGRQLGESLEISRIFKKELTETQKLFIETSQKKFSQLRRLRRVAVATLIAMTIASSSLAFIAYQSRNAAIERRQETLRLVDFMMSDLADKLKQQGDIELIQTISNEALEILSGQPINGMNVDELVQRARTLVKLGELSKIKGNLDEAEKAFVSAHHAALLAKKISPVSKIAINECGQTSFWLGDLHRIRGNHTDARKYWIEYLSTSELLTKMEPGNSQWMIEESYALNSLGTLFFESGMHTEAIRLFKKSEKIKQNVVDKHPENDQYYIELLDTLSWIASSQESIGHLNDALIEDFKQTKILRDMISRNGKADALKRRLANTLVRTATLSSDMGRIQDAIIHIKESRTILSGLIDKQPKNKEWLRDKTIATMKYGDIISPISDSKTVRSVYQSALEDINKIDVSEDSPYEWRRLDALIRFKNEINSPYSKESIKQAASLIEEIESIHESNKNDAAGLIALANALMDMHDALSVHGDEDSALKYSNLVSELLMDNPKLGINPRITAFWVLAQTSLGRQSSVEAESKWLHHIGYRRLHKTPGKMMNPQSN